MLIITSDIFSIEESDKKIGKWACPNMRCRPWTITCQVFEGYHSDPEAQWCRVEWLRRSEWDNRHRWYRPLQDRLNHSNSGRPTSLSPWETALWTGKDIAFPASKDELTFAIVFGHLASSGRSQSSKRSSVHCSCHRTNLFANTALTTAALHRSHQLTSVPSVGGRFVPVRFVSSSSWTASWSTYISSLVEIFSRIFSSVVNRIVYTNCFFRSERFEDETNLAIDRRVITRNYIATGLGNLSFEDETTIECDIDIFDTPCGIDTTLVVILQQRKTSIVWLHISILSRSPFDV